jgi:hypothetical protein
MRLLITFSILFVFSQTAWAQAERRACPGLKKAGASDEKQALCWFEREQSGDEECAFDNAEVSQCVLQTVQWCTSALLDDTAVANGCFLANVRAGQFDEALALKRYLRQPTEEAARCRQALEAISVKFASVPAGAEVLVDGRALGKTPAEVKLESGWWRTGAVARFGEGPAATEVAISQQQLMKAFDRHACTMAEVAVQGPNATAAPVTQTPQPAFSVTTSDNTARPQRRARVSALGIVAMVVGGAGVITGGVLLGLALTRKADILSVSKDNSGNWNETWTRSLQDKADSVKPLSIGGCVALGVGAALTTVGVVLLSKRRGAATESAMGDRALRLTGRGIEVSGSF